MEIAIPHIGILARAAEKIAGSWRGESPGCCWDKVKYQKNKSGRSDKRIRRGEGRKVGNRKWVYSWLG